MWPDLSELLLSTYLTYFWGCLFLVIWCDNETGMEAWRR